MALTVYMYHMQLPRAYLKDDLTPNIITNVRAQSIDLE